MKIVERKTADLRQYENNPRKNDAAVDKVAASIEKFGFIVPALITEEGEIVAGHTRVEAAIKLGIKKIPCIVIDDLDEDLIRQLRIVDNKAAELSSWDFEKLMIEMAEIKEIDMDVFGFGDFSENIKDESAAAGTESITQTFNNREMDLDDFGDDQFEIECPHCGFRWNE